MKTNRHIPLCEDYVPFEIAKLLKEKGFDEATNRYYNAQYDQIRTVSDTFLWNWNNEESMKRVDMGGAIAIPTLQMAMNWLREVHKIHISVEIGFDVDNHQYYFFAPSVCRFSDKSGEYENPFGEKEFDTYEEACEEGIKYCLENLI